MEGKPPIATIRLQLGLVGSEGHGTEADDMGGQNAGEEVEGVGSNDAEENADEESFSIQNHQPQNQGDQAHQSGTPPSNEVGDGGNTLCDCCLKTFDGPRIVFSMNFCNSCMDLFLELNRHIGVQQPLTGLENCSFMLFKFRNNFIDHDDMLESTLLFKNLERIRYVFFRNFQGSDNLISAKIGNKYMEGEDYRFVYEACVFVEQKIVSACTVRMFGRDVAFIGFGATLPKYQRRGFFRNLISQLEQFLRESRVREIVVASLPATVNVWMGFGFVQSYIWRRSGSGEVPFRKVQPSHHFEETSEVRVRQTAENQ